MTDGSAERALPEGIDADVLAAGAVCWREREGDLEVLLVHRPGSDDWSWPKGKIDKGETLPECAVREVAEETGYRIRLGLPLPHAAYKVGKGLDKHVSYWAAEVNDPAPPEPENAGEIDECRWVSASTAKSLLTRDQDGEQLLAVEQARAKGTLRAWPLIVVRHGKAYPRSRWHETERTRPLLALGSRQALALTGLLAAWAPNRLVSSPWKRCLATLAPYATASGKPMRLKAELSEKAHKRNPQKVAGLFQKILQRGKPTAVCLHRPVLPTVLATLAETAPGSVAAALPKSDPYLSPGEILVAYVKPGHKLRIVAFQRFRPVDD